MVGINKITSMTKKMATAIEKNKAIATSKTATKNPFAMLTKANPTTNEITPKLSENAKVYSFPQEVQEKILQRYSKFVNNKNQKIATSYLKNLLENNGNYNQVEEIMSSSHKLMLYITNKNNLNAKLKKCIYNNANKKEIILENLSLMSATNSNSYKILKSSKGFEHIANGKLNIEYLKDLKPNDKIDENYFYSLFDNIEKATHAKLSTIKGLDISAVEKLINAQDKEVCKNPKYLEEIIEFFEKSKNPQVLSKVLNTFEKDFDKSGNDILEILNMANQKPELISRVLQLKNLTPEFKYTLKTLMNNNLPQETLNDFIKFQQKNSNFCKPQILAGINYFINRNSASNKELLQTILKKAEEKQNKEILDLVYDANPNNLEYLKHILSEDKLNPKTIAKCQIMGVDEQFQKKENWNKIDKIYDEIYLPIAKTQKTKEGKLYALETAKLQLTNPTHFKELKDLGVIDFMKQGKINPRLTILSGFGENFTPEVFEDLKMLKNGESLIKKFDNFDNIFQKTKSGDVISIKNNMYINNNGRIERWNMTEEKFNELFPLVDRYTGMQGRDDCYLISVLDSVYRNPNSRGRYYKMFEQKGNDIYVTIPAYKNYKGTIKFPDGEIEIAQDAANAAKHVQMLEQTYARTALRSGENISQLEDPITTKNLDYLVERNRAGYPKTVLQEVLETNNSIQRKSKRRKTTTLFTKAYSICSIKKYANKPNYILNCGYIKSGRDTGHALQIKSYNPETQSIKFIDPTCTAYLQEKKLDDLSKELVALYITAI